MVKDSNSEYKTSWIVQSTSPAKDSGKIDNVVLSGAAQLVIDLDVPFKSSAMFSTSGASKLELVGQSSGSHNQLDLSMLTVNTSGSSVTTLGGVYAKYSSVNSSGSSAVEDLVVSDTAQLNTSGVAKISYCLLNESCRVECKSSGMSHIKKQKLSSL